MAKRPLKSSRKPSPKSRRRKPQPPSNDIAQALGVLVISSDDPQPASFTPSPATLDHIRDAYDSVNRGTHTVRLSTHPNHPGEYLLLISPKTPTPEFGGVPTPSPAPRPPTINIPNHSNPRNISFGPPLG